MSMSAYYLSICPKCGSEEICGNTATLCLECGYAADNTEWIRQHEALDAEGRFQEELRVKLGRRTD